MKRKNETHEERLARYWRERRETVRRIEKLMGGETRPLSDVAELLPTVPEWEVRS